MAVASPDSKATSLSRREGSGGASVLAPSLGFILSGDVLTLLTVAL
jgi:hypothetical protein